TTASSRVRPSERASTTPAAVSRCSWRTAWPPCAPDAAPLRDGPTGRADPRAEPRLDRRRCPSGRGGRREDDPADGPAVGERLQAGRDLVEAAGLADERLDHPLVREPGELGVALPHGGRVEAVVQTPVQTHDR